MYNMNIDIEVTEEELEKMMEGSTPAGKERLEEVPCCEECEEREGCMSIKEMTIEQQLAEMHQEAEEAAVLYEKDAIYQEGRADALAEVIALLLDKGE